ncbi:hypothetical protein DHEL01_v202559 [Diaporthe helianthi]|uniref:YMC020W-like alpha/beta hydrolase domain-containing protein n=1 Tax=Diaporthe helianthi TaxID=158607 RepID=A0A2P5I973_DIAHE|nr:hypothetical protein DHEL01_v202559 [Diaporthe helianthi]
MISRKRARRGGGTSGPSSSTTSLQPTRASTSSQVSDLSAAPTTAPPSTSQSASESAQGMPPPALRQLDTSSKSLKSYGSAVSVQEGNKSVHKTTSWYGSWPRKSTPSTSIQRETILGSPLKSGSMPDFSRFEPKRTSDAASLSGASQASVNTMPKVRETDTDGPATKDDGKAAVQESTNNSSHDQNNHTPKDDTVHAAKDNSKGNGAPPVDVEPPTADTPQRLATSSGWLGGWFTSNPVPENTTTENENTMQENAPSPKEGNRRSQTEPPPETNTAASGASEQPEATGPQRSLTMWIPFWSGMNAPAAGDDESAKAPESSSATVKGPEGTEMSGAPPSNAEPANKPAAGSTWAFWSKDTPKSPGEPERTTEPGELAVMGDGSENSPKRANSTDMSRDQSRKPEAPREGPGKAPGKIKQIKDKVSKKKKNRPQSMDIEPVPPRPQTPQSDAASVKADSPSQTKAKTPTTATRPSPPNLLLPSFKGTYKMKENPPILKQIASLLLRTQQKSTNHVFLTPEPPKVKKALAIGVHGLFPATYLRAMIGQPTGTSLKFADHGAEGIRRWAESHGCGDCEIEKVALEGEGKIAERVENLWKLLLNWIDHIKEADLIIVSCHSQGVPVSIMLLAKLIELGIITNAKIGVCAMAGVNLGPFPDYKSGMGMLMGSAAELWEFANSESEVSKRYEASVKAVLAYGVRITYVGSIDDQLVPIESAIYSTASHPYIYRAVFIDGRIHAPDFIAHLVGFACKLRNLGVSDHGLIRELSVPLAGSLYGGEGHSRLYDDGQVYDLAIAHALETTNVGDVPCEIQKFEGLTASNPYLLPWIMRGLLEEDSVKTKLSTETEELLRQFDDWKPVTKALKDVKYRLEAVRSKL